MQSFVNELSSQRIYRDLFWGLAQVAPLVLLVFLVLLLVARTRFAAAVGVVLSAVVAVTVGSVFHYTYATTTWGGHDSAIRHLDESAGMAGFAAGAIVYALGILLRAGRCGWHGGRDGARR
jgi:hypothetical protein